MNHPANETLWQIGDIVLHDADAKEPKMLMKVTAIDGERVTTQYLDGRHERKTYENDFWLLHDPACFGLALYDMTVQTLPQWALENWQYEFELCRLWNRLHPIGTAVEARMADNAAATVTESAAYMLGHRAYIRVAHGGTWLLSFVQPAKGEVVR